MYSSKSMYLWYGVDKKKIPDAAKQMLSEVELLLMVAIGGVGNSFPIILNLEAVGTSDKFDEDPQLE